MGAATATGDAIAQNKTVGGLLDLSGALAGQVKFPAIQNSSSDANTLDDYEEFSWTPVLTFAMAGDLIVVYSIQLGRGTKIGNMVYLDFSIACSTFNHTTASGILQITGLPVTSVALSNYISCGAVKWGGITKANYTQVNAEIGSTSSIIGFSISGSAQSLTTVIAADVPTGGGAVAMSGSIAFRTAT